MKKVSVIIPCYKMRQEWLERLFHSLCAQTIGFENMEIIFVVDASPDDTFERIVPYEQKYPDNVMLVNCTEKVGPGGARSLGISYAGGEYVAFVDQDDWVEACMYEHLYDKGAAYSCDVVESYNTRDRGYRYHDGEPERTGAQDAFYEFSDARDRKRFFETERPERRKYWAKIYRREFLLENNIDFPQNVRYDDNYFKGMVFYQAKRLYVVEEYLYHWMVNDSSISMQNDFSAHLDRKKVELLKVEAYQQRGLFPVYHDEMEYIFLEQFFANTFNTISTRNGTVPLTILDYMRQEINNHFPEYKKNRYISIRYPVWAMGEWIENALRGIAQVRGAQVEVPGEIYAKIAPLSFLDLLDTVLSQEELNWYCAIYNAFDKVAGRIDYERLKKEGQ